MGPCVEVGKFGLEEEVERLKRDKNVLMQELIKLRQQQQATDTQLQTMVLRLQGMERRQQQIMSFLAKVVQSPRFLAHFVQHQSDSNKKRRLKQHTSVESEKVLPPRDGQIVKYQPFFDDPHAIIRQVRNFDANQVCGVTLQEVHNHGISRSAEGPTPEFQETSKNYRVMDNMGDGDFMDLGLIGINGTVPIDMGKLSPDPDIESLLDDANWEQFLDREVIPIDGNEVESPSIVGLTNENEEGTFENGWDKHQNMDEITEQLGLLSSDNTQLL